LQQPAGQQPPQHSPLPQQLAGQQELALVAAPLSRADCTLLELRAALRPLPLAQQSGQQRSQSGQQSQQLPVDALAAFGPSSSIARLAARANAPPVGTWGARQRSIEVDHMDNANKTENMSFSLLVYSTLQFPRCDARKNGVAVPSIRAAISHAAGFRRVRIDGATVITSGRVTKGGSFQPQAEGCLPLGMIGGNVLEQARRAGSIKDSRLEPRQVGWRRTGKPAAKDVAVTALRLGPRLGHVAAGRAIRVGR